MEACKKSWSAALDILSKAILALCRPQQVERVERVQNKILWERYAARQRDLQSQNGIRGDNEQQLFHGTASASLNDIISLGLDVKYARGGALGKGQTLTISDHDVSA